jgi:hypothetical protein
MSATVIPARDVGRAIYEGLRQAAQEAYPELTEAEREVLLAEFLGAVVKRLEGNYGQDSR